MYRKVRNESFRHFDFMFIDLCCIQFSLIIAYMLRYAVHLPYTNAKYLNIAIMMPVMQICIGLFMGTYEGVLKRGYLQELKVSIKNNCYITVMFILVIFLLRLSQVYSRIVIFHFWWLCCVSTYITHILYKLYLSKKPKNEKYLDYLYLITKAASADKIIEGLLREQHSNYILKGVIIVDKYMTGKTINGVKVVANADTMSGFLKANIVDGVFINLDNDSGTVKSITEDCIKMGIVAHVNLDFKAMEIPNAVVESVNDFSVVSFCINTMTTRQLIAKRTIDICGSVLGLLAMAAAFVIVAPIIYIQSPGPVFFSQERVGRNGRRFKLYKFRSMYMDAEERKKDLMKHNKMEGHMFKIDNDPRIIPIGKFIRNNSIDELPQFINILLGDMSLVGTRPPTVDEYDRYELHHKKRLAIKPGLTGMWQVSGRSDITNFEEVVALDTQYIEKWNMGLDIKILFKTVGVVLKKKGSV